MGKGKKSSSKGVEMPTPKWYAVYYGELYPTELRESAMESLERLKDSNKAVRGEQYGLGPWYAVKVGRDCVVKQAKADFVGPYLTPHITLHVAEILNRVVPQGYEKYRELFTIGKPVQVAMELEDVK